MIRAVVDTNVLVSGLIKPDGAMGAVLKGLRHGRFTTVISSELLRELISVLAYPKLRKKYKLNRSAVESLLALLSLRGEFVFPQRAVHVCRDPDDNMLLEAAIAGQADYIVSGDADVLALKRYEKIKIMSPVQFLAMLRE